jgi:hypothetical protein
MKSAEVNISQNILIAKLVFSTDSDKCGKYFFRIANAVAAAWCV